MSALNTAWQRFWRLRWWIKGPAILLVLLVLVGLFAPASDEAPTATSQPAPAVERTAEPKQVETVRPARTPEVPAMFGTKYSIDVKTRLDGMVAAKDCAGLQNQFDNAELNDAATRSRTGSGAADLMGYIDGQMRQAGCYSR